MYVIVIRVFFTFTKTTSVPKRDFVQSSSLFWKYPLATNGLPLKYNNGTGKNHYTPPLNITGYRII